jgi:hypothetical protein
MRQLIGAAVLFAGLTAGAVHGQGGPITLKLKKPGPGESVKETKTETSKTKIKISVMGMDQTMTEEGQARFEYTDKVIARPEKAAKPTELERTYAKAEVTKNGTKEDLGLAGKTVHIKKAGDKYTFTVGGKPVEGKAAEVLTKEFDGKSQSSEQDFLPGKPVKVGETWTVDVLKASAELADGGLVIDKDKSKANGKLVKVEDKGGRKFGQIVVTMDLTVSKIKPKDQPEIPLKDGSKLAIEVLMTGCIDGTEATGGGTMTMKGDLTGEITQMGITAGLVFGLEVKVEGQTTEVKKK